MARRLSLNDLVVDWSLNTTNQPIFLFQRKSRACSVLRLYISQCGSCLSCCVSCVAGKLGSQIIIPYHADPYEVHPLRMAGDLGQILFQVRSDSFTINLFDLIGDRAKRSSSGR